MAKIDRLLAPMKESGASDLHVSVGEKPKYRLHGDLEAIEGEPVITDEWCEEYLYEITNERQLKSFLDENDLDFAHAIEGVARFRVNFMVQEHGVAAVFRLIPNEIKNLDDLGAPKSLLKFVERGQGLVLVTGPTGSGKTTTLAALIDFINAQYARHILTIEEPIEFVHENKRSLITQREVGEDTRTFADALRSSMREDPNVILVGEMRDAETIALALTCAETGVLVFGTLHTNSAGKTIDRIVDVFPADQQAQVRIMLAGALSGVVAQQLLRTKDGKGRVAAFEVLVGSPALSSVIRTGETTKIESIIQGGGSEGMQTMDSAIVKFLEADMISGKEAYEKSFDKKAFEQYFSLEDDEEE